MPLAVHLANEEMMWVVYKQRTLNFATKFEISWLICKYIFLFLSYLLSSYYGPSIFLGAADIAVIKTLKQSKIKQPKRMLCLGRV